MWSTSLSMDMSAIHLQIQKCLQNSSWEQTRVPDHWKRIYRTTQNSRSSPEPLEWEHWLQDPRLPKNKSREYQIVRIYTKETTWIQDQASPNHQKHSVQDASSKQQTTQKYKLSHQQTGWSPHLVLPIRGGKKNSAQISPYMKLTQTTGPNLGGQKPKGRKNSALKPGKRKPQTQ